MPYPWTKVPLQILNFPLKFNFYISFDPYHHPHWPSCGSAIPDYKSLYAGATLWEVEVLNISAHAHEKT